MAENNLQQIESQAQQARAQVEAQKKSTQKARTQLTEARKRLPTRKSARALRTGATAGLNGRAKRVQIKKAEERIQSETGRVEKFGKELSKFEKEKLAPVEKQIKQVKAEKSAFERARKIFRDVGALPLSFGGTGEKLVDKYLRQFKIEKQLAAESQSINIGISEKIGVSGVESLSDFEKKRLDVALRTGALKIDGAITGDANGIKSLRDYNKYIDSLKTEEVKIDTTAPTPLPAVKEKALVSPGLLKKLGGIFKPSLLTSVSALSVKPEDLKGRDAIQVNDIDGTSRISMGDAKVQPTRAGQLISSIIGTKEDFERQEEKARQISTGSVISAAEFTDPLKGEEFRKQGELRIERFGTATEQLPRVETKTLTRLREESLILGGADRLFVQEAPKSLGAQVLEFTPIAGQIRPTIEAGRRLSEAQTGLVGAESILGAGQVSQKEVRKEFLSFGVQAGLLGADVAFGASGARAVAGAARNIGARGRQVAIEKALSELEKKPIRYLQQIDKETGKVTLKGFQESRGLQREINIIGDVKKTESGFKFIPKAEGTSGIKGKIKVGKKEETFLLSQKFEVGSKGTSVVKGSVGEIPVSQTLSFGTFQPKAQTFAITKKKVLSKRAIKDIEKQFEKNILTGGDVVKEIQTGTSFGLKPKLSLETSTKDIGIVFEKQKPVKDIGKKFTAQVDKRTPLSKTFGQGQIQEVEVVSKPTIDLPVVRKGLAKQVVKVPTVKTEISGLPVGGSAFEGTGLFERTEVSVVSPTLLDSQVQPAKIETRQDSFQGLGLVQKPEIKVRTVQDTILTTKPSLTLKQIQQPSVKQIQQPSIKQVQSPTARQRIFQVVKQVPVTRVKTKTKVAATIPVATKTKVVEPTVIGLAKVLAKGKYKVKVRKGGKDVKIAEAQTLPEAKEKLLKRLKTTLRASGIIERNGKRVDPGFLGEGFRRGKKEPRRVVEVRAKRIKKAQASQEAKEIQFFRGKSKKRFF